MRAAALILIVAAVPATAYPASQAAEPDRLVVVLVFDGLAATLVERQATPALDRLRDEGAWSHRLVGVAPTVSLPNGISLSTGCLPATHGVVGNRFLDPDRGLYDHHADAEWLQACEHIQETAGRQGVQTTLLGWYGAERGGRPTATIVGPVSHACTPASEQRRATDLIARLRTVPPRGRHLLLAYFCQPDAAQHFEGVTAVETARAIARTDALVGEVRALLESRGGDAVLAVATDHGMTPVTDLININRILRKAGVRGRAVANDGLAHIYLEDPRSAPEARAALRSWPLFDAYLRGHTPAWLGMGSGPRVGDLLLVTWPPYFFADVDLWPWYTRFLAAIGPETASAGGRLRADHGYAPWLPDMRGVLYLWGGPIHGGRAIPAPRAIDLHPTIAALLGIDPGQPLDGRVLEGALADR